MASTARCREPGSGEWLELELRPRMDAQEMLGKVGTVNYWEGACEVFDASGRAIGKAFVELTGYDREVRALK